MSPSIRLVAQAALGALFAAVMFTHAVETLASDKPRAPQDKVYTAECGSCHVAFPPKLLPAASWQSVMARLDRHYGTDASIEKPAQARIGAYLQQYAGSKTAPANRESPRITETSWFAREHREVPGAAWSRASVKSRANCAACHTRAEAGSFREREIQIPR